MINKLGSNSYVNLSLLRLSHFWLTGVEAVKLILEKCLFLIEMRVETIFVAGRAREQYHTQGLSDGIPPNRHKRGPKKLFNKVGLRLTGGKRCYFVYLIFPLNSYM